MRPNFGDSQVLPGPTHLAFPTKIFESKDPVWVKLNKPFWEAAVIDKAISWNRYIIIYEGKLKIVHQRQLRIRVLPKERDTSSTSKVIPQSTERDEKSCALPVQPTSGTGKSMSPSDNHTPMNEVPPLATISLNYNVPKEYDDRIGYIIIVDVFCNEIK